MSVLQASYDGNLPLLKSLKDNGEDINIQDKDGENALIKACRGTGNIDTVKWLIQQGLSPEYKNNKGYNAFLFAAYWGHLSVLKFLKEINVDIKVTGSDGENALHAACIGKGDINTIKLLVEQGFSPEHKANNGHNAFHCAAGKGNLSVLKFFKEINVDIKVTDSKGQNALLTACIGKGDINTIKWLVEQGFSPEHKDNNGHNAFHCAAGKGNLSVLKFFKEINVDIKVTDSKGQNALHTACIGKGDINTIKWLVEQGFSPEHKDNNGRNAFHYAAGKGHLSVLKFFKEINVDIKVTDSKGQNALHAACIGKGDINTIQWLVEQGFSPEHKDNNGRNAFHYAAGGGNLSVLKFFKEINVDIKVTGSQGENALHAACFGKGDINTIQWLVEQGFSPEHKDNNGLNAFHCAAGEGHLSVLKFFKEINVDIKVTGSHGLNALHTACIGKGDINTIKWLVEQGFSIHTPASDGQTPFYLTLLKGHTQLVKFFLRLKPDLVNKTLENG